MRIVICDHGLGNLRSVERAVKEAARGHRVDVEVTADARRVTAADRLVIPGQGAFRDCVSALSGGLGDAIRGHLEAERPYLGICLGLQVLFRSSDEAPGCAGLGVLDGRVVRLTTGRDSLTGEALKIPHIGWNTADPSDQGASRARFDLVTRPEHFYFVHSFVVAPADRSIVAATTTYGEPFASAIAYGNVFACQFHPEKSQRAGLALLERFIAS